jgi:hypothetical protein
MDRYLPTVQLSSKLPASAQVNLDPSTNVCLPQYWLTINGRVDGNRLNFRFALLHFTAFAAQSNFLFEPLAHTALASQ